MQITLVGTLIHIGESQRINPNFSKQDIVILLDRNGAEKGDEIKCQAINKAMAYFNNFTEGELVVIDCILKGNSYEKNGVKQWMTTLNVSHVRNQLTIDDMAEHANDLPF